jgi:hypothetical protein
VPNDTHCRVIAGYRHLVPGDLKDQRVVHPVGRLSELGERGNTVRLESLDDERSRGIDMPVADGTEEWTQLQLSNSITTDSLDARLIGLSDTVWQQPINLDFSKVSSVEIAALQYLLSLLNERGRLRLETALSVPKQRHVRDLIQAWDFPAAASVVVGSPFRRLVWHEDANYVGEQRKPYVERHVGDARTSTNAYTRLLGNRFFCFVAHVFNTDLQAESIMAAERSRWCSPLVLGYLDNCLKASGSEIARVVVYELLVNALRRPGADLVTIVPFVDNPDPATTSGGDLCISVWDNGKTMVDSVRSSLRVDRGAASDVPASDDKFHVVASGWSTRVRRYTADWIPGVDATDEELLLCSLLPTASRGLSRQAYGMYALFRCVIDLFGGGLQIRTGNQLMNLHARSRARGRAGRTYEADLHRVAGRRFHGNLITVRVPMTYAG